MSLEHKAGAGPLDIAPIRTKAKYHPSPPLMQQIGIKFPFSLSIIGATGSGKTVVAVNLLTNPNMYGRFFDEIHLFGETARSDDSWQVLRLPEKHVHHDTTKIIPDLQALLKQQRKDVETKGVLRCKRVCVIFEDATTNLKLLNSPHYIQAYVQNRHYGISTISMAHKYHAQTRICRLNSHHMFIFPCTADEIVRIVKETQPAGLKRREYEDVIKFCFEPDKEDPHPFLWINFKVPQNIRIRKGLTRIVNTY